MTEPVSKEVLCRLLHLLWSYRRPSRHHRDSLGSGPCKSNLKKKSWVKRTEIYKGKRNKTVIRCSPSFRCGRVSLSSWQVVPGSSLVPRGQLKNSASSSWDHLLVTSLGYRKTVFSIHSVGLTCFTFKARLQSKWGHSVTVYNVHGIRKLAPTFSCPSLCFGRPGLCFELCAVWRLYFLTGLCLGFHLPGAPGFPCERHGTMQTFRIFGEMDQALHTSQNNLACCICVQRSGPKLLRLYCVCKLLLEVPACPSFPLDLSCLGHLSFPVVTQTQFSNEQHWIQID